MLCLVIPGTLDSVLIWGPLIWRQGVRSASWGHIMGTIVLISGKVGGGLRPVPLPKSKNKSGYPPVW